VASTSPRRIASTPAPSDNPAGESSSVPRRSPNVWKASRMVALGLSSSTSQRSAIACRAGIASRMAAASTAGLLSSSRMRDGSRGSSRQRSTHAARCTACSAMARYTAALSEKSSPSSNCWARIAGSGSSKSSFIGAPICHTRPARLHTVSRSSGLPLVSSAMTGPGKPWTNSRTSDVLPLPGAPPMYPWWLSAPTSRCTVLTALAYPTPTRS
jgi:hypothetical protein